MKTSANFQQSEFYSEQSHCGSSAAARRMLNLSVALMVGFGLIAGTMVVSRAQQSVTSMTPAAKNASIAVYGDLAPLTWSNCVGPACDIARDVLRAGHSLAGAAVMGPPTTD
jgi:hypothetical protein